MTELRAADQNVMFYSADLVGTMAVLMSAFGLQKTVFRLHAWKSRAPRTLFCGTCAKYRTLDIAKFDLSRLCYILVLVLVRTSN